MTKSNKKNTGTVVLILILFVGFLSSTGLSLKMHKDLENQEKVNASVLEELDVSKEETDKLNEKFDKLTKENEKQKKVTEEKDKKIGEQESKINTLIEESNKKDSEISDLISKKEQEKKEQEKLALVESEKEAITEQTSVKEEVSTETVEQEVINEPEENSNTGETLTVEATAYSTNQPSMSNLTYTEINLDVNPNVIAVDPNFIELGSTVYIEGYGTFVAGDTGSDIVGNRIDVHMTNLDNAIAFGRKTLEVTVTN